MQPRRTLGTTEHYGKENFTQIAAPDTDPSEQHCFSLDPKIAFKY